MIWDWLDAYDLHLINGDEKCKGVFTWEGRDSRTAIDMVLMNSRMYGVCRSMVIDEGKDITAMSDHNLISVELGLGGGGGVKFGGERVRIEYYKKDGGLIREVGEKVEREWRAGMGYERLWGILGKAQDETLKKSINCRVGGGGVGD